MNRRLTIVFLALIASLTAAASGGAQTALVLDPAKLRLASLNAVIVDASANRPVYAKGADDVTPIASLTKLMTAMVTLDAGLSHGRDDRDRHGRPRLSQGHDIAAAHGHGAPAARNAAPRADVLRKSRGIEPRANLSGRHAGVRRRDERQGGPARDDAHAIRRSDGPLRAERVDGERPRRAGGRGGGVSADPRVQHDGKPLSSRCSRRGRCWASTTRTTSSRTRSGTSSCRRPGISARPASASSCWRRSRRSRS